MSSTSRNTSWGPIRTLAVWCPDWPISAAGIAPEVPAAVLHANRVVACSAGARAEGIRRGMRKRETQSRCPDIIILDNDIDRDARAFSSVVNAVGEFTPLVEIIRPGMCVVATRGPARYFGGETQLVGQITSQVTRVLTDVGGIAQVGIADGPFAAQLAARQSTIVAAGETPEFLAPFPVSVLEMTELCDVLVNLGIRTLGDLAALPAGDVLARFGREGAFAHALAGGDDDTLFTGAPPEEDWSITRELDPPETRVDALSFIARQCAEELCARLDDGGLAVTALTIEAESEHSEVNARIWRADHKFSVQAVADRTRWQLDGWLNGPTQLRPSAGIAMLRLVPERVVANTGKQVALWGGEKEADLRAARAFVRLQGMFGHTSVGTMALVGDRNVSEQMQFVPWGDSSEAVARSAVNSTGLVQPWPGKVPSPAPSLILQESQACEVTDVDKKLVSVNSRGAISSHPIRFVFKQRELKVVAWAGPWPVDERWWDQSRARRQARLQLVTDDGSAWLVHIERGCHRVVACY